MDELVQDKRKSDDRKAEPDQRGRFAGYGNAVPGTVDSIVLAGEKVSGSFLDSWKRESNCVIGKAENSVRPLFPTPTLKRESHRFDSYSTTRPFL